VLSRSTNVGLHLPATALEGRQVQERRSIATAPGSPMTEPASMDDEPWKIHGPDVKYLPMQAGIGDYALFFRKAAVELTFEGKRYLVVPQAAILVLVREGTAEETEKAKAEPGGVGKKGDRTRKGGRALAGCDG